MTAGTAEGRELRLRDGRSVRIRRAVPADAAGVLEYLRQVGGETPNLTFGAEGPGLTEAEEREYLARVAESDNSLAILALAGDTIVAGLTFDGGRRPRLRHAGEFGISVAQAYAGLGIGRALLEYMIAWAEGTGVVRKINLKVREDNAGAIGLYQRLGWVHEGRTTRDTIIDGKFNDCLLMGRTVDPA
jgi:RimJ/RimL family protein N-acetyltransferase